MIKLIIVVAMLVNPSLQTIFLSNPKCASSSVEKLLNQCQPSIVLRGGGLPPAGFGLKHIDAEFLATKIMPTINLIYPDIEFTVFCVVREPLDQLFSLWKYGKNEGKRGTDASTIGISFENFIQNIVYNMEDNFSKSNALPKGQARFIYNGKQLVSEKVFAIEKINEVENFLSERSGKKLSIDIKNQSMPINNEVKKISEELILKLKTYLKRDYEFHNLASLSPDEVKKEHYKLNSLTSLRS